MIEGNVTVAYFGAAAFELTTSTGKRILVDPCIRENHLCKKEIEYFYGADLILVSHGAWDHMGDTLEIMKNGSAVLVCGQDVYAALVKEGIPKERIKHTLYGDYKEVGGIGVKAVYAQHVSKAASGKETFYGIPMGYVITTEDRVRLFHTGDTALFSDLKLIGMLHRPNIFMVGISCVREGHGSEMNPGEAALAALWVAPDIVIPMHYPPESDEPAQFCDIVKSIAPNVQPIAVKPNSQIVYHRSHVAADQ